MKLPSITVIIPTYGERANTIAQKTIDLWRKQPVDEVWVAYGSDVKDVECFQERPKLAPVHVWQSPIDIGTKFDYALAPLTKTDYIICADDDVFPQPGFTEDLIRFRHVGAEDKELFGIIGRKFTDQTYKKCPWFGSKSVDTLTAVDFVGCVILGHRSMFGFDMRGMTRNIDDLWLAMKIHPNASKWVVPTTKFETAPVKGMFHDGQLKLQRQEFYAEYWKKCLHS